MQLITYLSAATAIVATASADSARTAVLLNKTCDKSQPHASIHNRCEYPVHIWSVAKGDGCPTGEAVTLKKGESYSENYYDPKGSSTGVSIKISKDKQCKGSDITQLEYFLEKTNLDYAMNYLDVSYVDCEGGDCPARKDGYYLVAGNQVGKNVAAGGNTICPILSCTDAASCDKMSYVLPDDVQTKTCHLDQNMDFYMCGGNAPTDDTPASPPSTPASSSKQVVTSASQPTTTLSKVVSSSAADYKVKAAAVTNTPQVKDADKPKVKTQVVYVTAYEYVNAKRDQHAHVHAHSRRHQPFNA